MRWWLGLASWSGDDGLAVRLALLACAHKTHGDKPETLVNAAPLTMAGDGPTIGAGRLDRKVSKDPRGRGRVVIRNGRIVMQGCLYDCVVLLAENRGFGVKVWLWFSLHVRWS